MYYEGTSEHELMDYAWVFGTSLNSADYTKNNLWWDRLTDQGDAAYCW